MPSIPNSYFGCFLENTIEIIKKEQTNPNIIGLRNCMLKIATKTPLNETDTISIIYLLLLFDNIRK